MAFCPRLATAALCLLMSTGAVAQTAPAPDQDSDADGLSDALEQALLQRFQPDLLFAQNDCATAPTAFLPDTSQPTPVPHTEGTLYGQVTPRAPSVIEVRYFHLWARDCGQYGHPLDAERVSVLLSSATGASAPADDWKALYWFAAAHEGTVCDSSRIHTAVSLHAETAGATAWVSKDKHASFLERARCDQGCGADDCAAGVSATSASRPVVNLGEPGHILNGATWTTAASWQLSAKMLKTDFLPAHLTLLAAGVPSGAPGATPTSVAVGRRPMTGFQTALAIASEPPQKTGMALEKADRHTARALEKGGQQVHRSLRLAYAATVGFLRRR